MTVLVESFELRESERTTPKMCNECMFVPAWVIRAQLERGSVGYACSEHVDTVLYKVDRGLIPARTLEESGNVEPGNR